MVKPTAPTGINALALTPGEIASLRQKGLIRGTSAAVQKDVLSLVRLAHPDGWSVLLGLVAVTPALAEGWLKTNFGNRPVSEDTVTAYARDAAAGIWVTTHQGIAFSDKDELIDGQHRLLAIIKSGIACTVMVSFGWGAEIQGRPMKRMDVIDRGRTRSVADQLKIQHNLKNGGLIASISNALANLCYGERTRRLSVGQTLDIYRAFQPAVDWIIERRSKAHGFKSAGVLAGFAFALRTQCSDDPLQPFDRSATVVPPVARMFEALNHASAEMRKNSSLMRLREFLTSEDAHLLTRSLDRGLAEMVLRAIHLESLGEDCLKTHALVESAPSVKFFTERQPARVAQIAALFKLPVNPKAK